MDNYNYEYQRQLKILQGMMNQKRLELEKAMADYHNLKANNLDRKNPKLGVSVNKITKKRKELEEITNKVEYLRPTTKQDIDYRLKIYGEYPKMIRNLLDDNSSIRFYGLPLYQAKEVIYSGELVSSKNRLENKEGIPVTNKYFISLTLSDHIDLINFYLPTGCIFAIIPFDEMESLNGYSYINNINFKEEPDRLYGIITSEENIKRVTLWAAANNISTNKIFTFTSFLKLIPNEEISR